MDGENGIFIYIEPVEPGVPGDYAGLREALADELASGRLAMYEQALRPTDYMVFCVSSNAALVYSLLYEFRFHSTEEGNTVRLLGAEHTQPGGAQQEIGEGGK